MDIISHSPEQTARMGVRLGGLLQPGDLVCLSGDLGAGKTVFAAGIGRGWGSRYPVTSPTFTLMHEHRRTADDQVLIHMDCYRLERPQDAHALGLDDLLDGNGPIVMEWPEQALDALPDERLWIELRTLEHTRRNLTLEAVGTRYQTLVRHFREATFGV